MAENTITDATLAIRALNLDLTPEQRDILYEFTRAREVMATLQTPGWQHIQDLALSKLDQIQAKYLGMRNCSPEALWAMHIAVQYVTDFWEALAAQLATTGDWLKDPEAVKAMLAGAVAPAAEDLDAELPNVDNPMPRFPEDRA